MIQILFLFIIFLIFFLLILLIIPYYYSFSFKYQQKFTYSLSLLLIFIKIKFSSTGKNQILLIEILNFKKRIKLNKNSKRKSTEKQARKFPGSKIKQAVSKNDKVKKPKNKSSLNFDYKLINKENFSHLFKFILDIIKILKADYLKLNLLFSFEDPYYNGLFLAYYYTFKEVFDYPNIKVEVNWQEVIFEADGSIGGKIRPGEIIYHILKFIFSLKSLKIFWRLYQSNSKKG
ncbi:hypothetical protein [Halanaerobium kushneri]|uniref:DUF2953 domain-containing protein n=1 Tax=Halanaerobium kushneri TaxID=56779 RepID=A0A1N6XQL5_9FIRM|nr:hypothetical protein [Halanaerobium kushneri]SIR04509.1 hypothetical protein SAMN05421834_11226 [Halanaerobium kushneri]